MKKNRKFLEAARLREERVSKEVGVEVPLYLGKPDSRVIDEPIGYAQLHTDTGEVEIVVTDDEVAETFRPDPISIFVPTGNINIIKGEN